MFDTSPNFFTDILMLFFVVSLKYTILIFKKIIYFKTLK